jgi:hypothetical protein
VDFEKIHGNQKYLNLNQEKWAIIALCEPQQSSKSSGSIFAVIQLNLLVRCLQILIHEAHPAAASTILLIELLDYSTPKMIMLIKII